MELVCPCSSYPTSSVGLFLFWKSKPKLLLLIFLFHFFRWPIMIRHRGLCPVRQEQTGNRFVRLSERNNQKTFFWLTALTPQPFSTRHPSSSNRALITDPTWFSAAGPQEPRKKSLYDLKTKGPSQLSAGEGAVGCPVGNFFMFNLFYFERSGSLFVLAHKGFAARSWKKKKEPWHRLCSELAPDLWVTSGVYFLTD